MLKENQQENLNLNMNRKKPIMKIVKLMIGHSSSLHSQIERVGVLVYLTWFILSSSGCTFYANMYTISLSHFFYVTMFGRSFQITSLSIRHVLGILRLDACLLSFLAKV